MEGHSTMSDNVVELAIETDIGVLTVNAPPVNALSIDVRRGIETGLTVLLADPAVKAVVLICEGRTFFAGADISEFDRPPTSPTLYDVLRLLESAAKPVVAAIHGSALGGGFEVALVCRYRMAVPSAKLGLPEVRLGLLPGGGGTQRLPRLIGIEKAFELISTGRSISAAEGLDLGVLDALAREEALRDDAIAFARSVSGQPLRAPGGRGDGLADPSASREVIERLRGEHSAGKGATKARVAIIDALEAAVTLPLDQGLAMERDLFAELRASSESKALRYGFLAERAAAKITDIAPGTRPATIRQIGIVGAGTMGTGIAMAFIDAGFRVRLAELNQDALDRGMASIARSYAGSVRKGRMNEAEVQQRMSLVEPVVGLENLGTADLIVEAVFEDLTVKRQLFSALDRVARQDAILASNTSFLDLDDIARATLRPELVVGLHFFSPANIMRLLEIVRGRKTGDVALATAINLAKQLGKTPVVSRVCHGFIANRIMSQRGKQANALILEGHAPHQIDAVMTGYGFPMGHFQMIDLAGLDVLGRAEGARTLYGDFVRRGRLGQKRNGGFYDYDDNRKARPSPAAAEIIADFAAHLGVVRYDQPASEEDLLFRLLLPVVNEGSRLLEEGIACRASDIDVAAMLGYGWPAHTGGPMFWAQNLGLREVVARLRDYAARHGDDFQPSALLCELAEHGRGFPAS